MTNHAESGAKSAQVRQPVARVAQRHEPVLSMAATVSDMAEMVHL